MTLLKGTKRVWLVIFIIYIFVILRLTIFRSGHYDERQLNLILFADLIKIYRYMGRWHFFRLFLGNIFWFAPFGFILPILMKKSSFLKALALGFAFSLAIEVSQYIFRKGVAETDDLILNTFGVILGYGAYKLFQSYPILK